MAQLLSGINHAQRAVAEYLTDPAHHLLATATLVLAALEERNDRSPTELARLTGLSRGRLTHIADELAEAGLIARHRDPQDARRVLLSLTADGRVAAGRAAERVGELEAAVIDRLGPAGVDMLAQQLTGITSEADRLLAPDPED